MNIEQEIQEKGLTAPRVTPSDIEANIVSVHYFIAGDAIQHDNAVHECGDSGWHLGKTQLLTICVIQMRDGLTVTGESACVSSENFDAEIGRKIARQNAVNKMWPLMGYALNERLSRNPVGIVTNNNQPGSDHIVTAPPYTTIDVGTELFTR